MNAPAMRTSPSAPSSASVGERAVACAVRFEPLGALENAAAALLTPTALLWAVYFNFQP